MKFFASALCLAGVLASGAAYADHDHNHHKGSMTGNRHMSSYDSTREWKEYGWNTADPQFYVYAGERLFYRPVFYPDLPSEREIANKLADLITKQRIEIAHLNAFGDRAQTVGFTNVSTVYDFMERDHQHVVDMASDWMLDYGFPLPPQPVATGIAVSMSPAQSVDHMLDMHIKSFNETLAKLEGERSHTVRGLLLVSAAATAKHISWLRTLDRDVEFGRRDLTALLRSQIDTTFLATNERERLAQIISEESIITTTTLTTTAQTGPTIVYVDRVVEIEKPVEVERVVERRVEVPVERIVERVVEKPVYIDRVAGQRQAVPERAPVRTRRPAK